MKRLPVRKTIEKLTISRLAKAMDLPVSTIHRWKEADRIPGKKGSHQIRVAQFEAAVAELEAQDGQQVAA